jgi:PII-like signaling protein
MSGSVKILFVIVKETDVWNDEPLYAAIVQRLRQLEAAGATVQAGIMGFGRHHRVHHKGLFGIPDDRAITIVAVDTEPKLRAILPELRSMSKDALMLLIDGEAIP